MPPARFTKRARLLNAAQFDAVFKQGKRFTVGSFTAVLASNELGYPRVGFAFSKKQAPSSVQRNRVRRLLRERFRLQQAELAPVDLVLMLRSKLPADAASVTTAANDFWLQLARRCRAS